MLFGIKLYVVTYCIFKKLKKNIIFVLKIIEINNMSSFTDSKIFDLIIYTPSDTYLASKVKSVHIPSAAGTFQVLVNHAPIIAAITNNGIIRVVNENDITSQYLVQEGIAELHSNQLTITVSEINTISYKND